MYENPSNGISKAGASRFFLALTLFMASALLEGRNALAIELGLPAKCELGKDCFLQQYPDMDSTDKVADPVCGGQTYDGHKGTDLRILSMEDVKRGTAVIAVEDGEILRVRDGEADRLVETKGDRDRIAGKECGNGLVMRLGEGYEVQYCHLQQGSLTVAAGDQVVKGSKLGNVGASGLAQFPHVHITVTKQDQVIDPLTGRLLANGCDPRFSRGASLFDDNVLSRLEPDKPQILSLGVAGNTLDHASLVRRGPPPLASSDDPIFVAWGWFANLNKDDLLEFKLRTSEGLTLIERTYPPIERNKATYSAFVGKKKNLHPGTYVLDITIRRNEKVTLTRTLEVEIK